MRQIHIYGPQFSTFVRSVQLCCEEKGVSYTVGTQVNGEQLVVHEPARLGHRPAEDAPRRQAGGVEAWHGRSGPAAG